MGILKGFKDMKDMVQAAPGMMESANELGAHGDDQSLLPEIAQSNGVSIANWDTAKGDWRARIKDDRAVGSKLRVRGEEQQQQQQLDVKVQMGDAKARMDAMNAAFAASQPQAFDPASEARRVEATATVESAQQTGMMVNMSQMVQVILLVMLPDGLPLPVTTQLLVPFLNLARLQPGAQLSVSIDPTIPASVRIDWSN